MEINKNKSIYILKRDDLGNVDMVRDSYVTFGKKTKFKMNITNQSLIKLIKENHRFYINHNGVALWKLKIKSVDYTNPKLIKIDGISVKYIGEEDKIDKLLLKAQKQERERQISKLLDDKNNNTKNGLFKQK